MNQQTNAIPPVICLKHLLSMWDDEAAVLHDAYASGQQRGPITGFTTLDAEISGAFTPGVHVIHGVPGSGKTALALQIASTCGCPALLTTCEMSPLELLRRITARCTKTYLGRLKTGELTPEQSRRLVEQSITQTPNLVLQDATQTIATLESIRSAAIATRRLTPELPHLLLVVDSLHSWADRVASDMTEYDRLNVSIEALRKLGQELGCPILCIAERNRASMASGGLSAGAGTRKIEYAAETVIDLDVDSDRKADAYGNSEVTLTLAKNRHGTPGKRIKMAFHGATQTFTEA